MKLSANNLTFAYKKKSPLILQDVSFTAPSGRITTILGANGAGKSTLIKCLNYILEPWEGRIFADGKDVGKMRPKERARLIGYVPQNTELKTGLTVWETILSGRNPHMNGKPSRKDLEITEKLLHDFSLEKHAFSDVTNLSGGERQRVLMGRALAQTPGIILLDEPTSNLDLRYQLEVMELLHQLSREQGITVITIIHDLNMALRFGDWSVVLNNNRVAASGIPLEIMTEELIRNVYQVEVIMGNVAGKRVLVPVTKKTS
ncbi:MAG: ABC transporter ATP-binding protein [Candidatus Limivivens sp.]|nr:ABC transporter ATP-binding protein [Candidatus Limivivens sp.]